MSRSFRRARRVISRVFLRHFWVMPLCSSAQQVKQQENSSAELLSAPATKVRHWSLNVFIKGMILLIANWIDLCSSARLAFIIIQRQPPPHLGDAPQQIHFPWSLHLRHSFFARAKIPIGSGLNAEASAIFIKLRRSCAGYRPLPSARFRTTLVPA
jgi:hypothetical protein